MKLATRISSFFLANLLAMWAFSSGADAVSMEQAKAQCHDKFVPVVRGCVRQKVMQNGGNPSQYIPGCRDSIMAEARECVSKLVGADSAPEGPPEIDLPPPSGKGRVVLVLSGIDGTSPYKDFAERIAKLGYYVVVMEGSQILSEDKQGGDRLAKAIAAAQNSSNALPGKVAVIGFSRGGGGALTYAERQPDTVAAVIAYYPATWFIAKVTDMKTFVGNFQVPLLAFAGAKDSFMDCCRLATIQSMQATAKEMGKSMDLVVYPNAAHNFIKGATYRADDANDAWKQTVAALSQYLGAP
jgi:carboxymethylenebutenolidase